MSTFDDPNREAVGLPPIWTGAGEEPEPHQQKSKKTKDADEVEVIPMESNAEDK